MRKLRKEYRDRYSQIVKIILAVVAIVILAVWAIPQTLNQMNGKGSKADKKENVTETKNMQTSVEASSKPKETSTKVASNENKTEAQEATSASSITAENAEVTIWLDDWVWLPIAAANGGNETTADSAFGKRGLTVHIMNNDSDNEKAEAFQSGEMNAMACTVNRLSLLSGQFYGNTEYIVPYLLDHSSGGDGIVARNNFTSIESLKDAKMAVGEGSVSHAMLIYLLNISNLNSQEFEQALNNVVTYPSSDEAAQAYLRGEVDAVATWQPYVSECSEMADSHILFSTKSSSSLIMDAMIFNKGFADENPETVSLMIDGMLEVVEDLKNGRNIEEYYQIFYNTFPGFEGTSKEELDTMFFDEAQFMDWHDNVNSYESGVVQGMFEEMCDVWNIIGAETMPSVADKVFDESYLQGLSSKYENTERKEDTALNINPDELGGYDALITKSFTLSFKPNVTEIVDEQKELAVETLDEFAQIAKVLDGALIIIEGNVSSRTNKDSPEFMKLSLDRAEAIKEELVKRGISEDRMFCYGNGAMKQKFENPQTSAEYALNRSVDVMFFTGEETY